MLAVRQVRPGISIKWLFRPVYSLEQLEHIRSERIWTIETTRAISSDRNGPLGNRLGGHSVKVRGPIYCTMVLHMQQL